MKIAVQQQFFPGNCVRRKLTELSFVPTHFLKPHKYETSWRRGKNIFAIWVDICWRNVSN